MVNTLDNDVRCKYVSYINKSKEEIKNEKKEFFNIPLAFDYKFKKMFSDMNNIRRTEYFISLFFDIPYSLVKGNVKILNNEQLTSFEHQKKGLMDIKLDLILPNQNLIIDLEITNKSLEKTFILRNFLYGAYNIVNQLKSEQKYDDIKTTIVISFDRGLQYITDDKIMDIYEMRNQSGTELTNKLQFWHINIEKCYKIWYLNDIEKYDEKERNIILFGALLSTYDIREIEEIVGGFNMEEKLKKDIIKTNNALNQSDDIMEWYDYEEDQRKIMESLKQEYKREFMEKGLEKGMKKGMKQGIEQGIKQGIEQGIEQKNIENAKKMKEKNIDINTISEITGLTLEQINQL